MADLKDFADKLVNLTVKEVNELADILKEEYGIADIVGHSDIAPDRKVDPGPHFNWDKLND